MTAEADPGVCVVIPAYNEAGTLRNIVARTLTHCAWVIVVDDGSRDGSAACLEGLPVQLLRNPDNQGKAYSLWRGMKAAAEAGARAVLTLDADGQHHPEDIPRFLRAHQAFPHGIWSGNRMANGAAFPAKRYYANKVANFWISWATGQSLADSQCGFRLYPTQLIQQLDMDVNREKSFVFESEILIKAARIGFPIYFLSIEAVYVPDARPSHFRGFKDITLITRMVAWKLISRGMYPQGLWRGVLASGSPGFERIGWDGVTTFLLSNLVIILSAGLGFFLAVAHILRLAITAPEWTDAPVYMVLGMKLSSEGGQPMPDYLCRLERACSCLERQPQAKVIILGGKTNNNSQYTEAQVGMDWLTRQGISPNRIRREENSRHTLENLYNARSLDREIARQTPGLITNRYHLARASALASGLGIQHQPCAAEIRWQFSLKNLMRVLKEAYLLHWYYTGKYWALWRGNKKMLRRIT